MSLVVRLDQLFDAAHRDDAEQLKSILSTTDSSAVPLDVNSINRHGATALHICASRGCVDAAKVLLEAGAEVNIKDMESGWTPLHRALYNDQMKMSFILIRAGATLDESSMNLHEKAYVSNTNFRTNRSNSIVDREGLSPLDLLSLKLYSTRVQESELYLEEQQSVLCFGKADFPLGVPLPKSSEVLKPRRIDVLSDKGITQLAANKYHSVALTATGQVYSWGHGRSGRLGHGDEASQPEPKLVRSRIIMKDFVQQIAAGENHTLALTDTGTVYSWGSDRFGQLGHGGKSSSATSATNLGIILEPRRVDTLKRMSVLGIACGDFHSLCFTNSGEVYSWGCNKHGQLGIRNAALSSSSGSGHCAFVPKRVFIEALTCGSRDAMKQQSTRNNRVVQIVASFCNSMLLCRCDSTVTMASLRHSTTSHSRRPTPNEVFQWGHGITQPLKVHFSHRSSSSTNANTQIGSSQPAKQTARRRSRSGSLGSFDGDCDDFVNVGGGYCSTVNILQITAGKHHYAGRSSDGGVFTWGLGADQLGHGTTESHLSRPMLVEALLPENGGGYIVDISASGNRTCAVTQVGDLFSWGATDVKGVLSPGLTNYIPLPRRVPKIKRAIAVAAGEDHTLVIASTSLPPLPLSDIFHNVDEFNEESGAVDDDDMLECSFESCGSDTPQNQVIDSYDELITTNGGTGNRSRSNSNTSHTSNINTVHRRSITSERSTESSAMTHEKERRMECSNTFMMDRIPRLFELCERELARSNVSMKTALSGLLFAEQFGASHLIIYCEELIRRNFDSILVQSKPSEIDQVVESLGFSAVCLKSAAREAASSSVVANKNDINLILTKQRTRSRDNSFDNSPSIKRVGDKDHSDSVEKSNVVEMKHSKDDEKPLTSLEIQKQIRSLRKKLAAIYELNEKVTSNPGYTVSPEQREKLKRREFLQSELVSLEQLLVRTTAREQRKASNDQLNEKSTVDVEHVNDVTCVSTTTAMSTSSPVTSKSEKMKPQRMKLKSKDAIPLHEFQSKKSSMNDATPKKESSASTGGPPTSFEAWSSMFSDTPHVDHNTRTPSSVGSMTTPKGWNNTPASSEKTSELQQSPAVSLRAVFEEQRQQSNPTITLSSAAPSGRTVLSPPSLYTTKKQMTELDKSCGIAWATSMTSASSMTNHSPTIPPNKSLTASSSMLNVSDNTTSSTETGSRMQFALGDFMQRSTKTSMKLSVPPEDHQKVKPAWTTTIKQIDTAPVADTNPSPKLSFFQIQEEEEKARLNSNMLSLQGNDNPWFIQRRPRADSMKKLFQEQEEEKIIEQLQAAEEKRQLKETQKSQKERTKVSQKNTSKKIKHKKSIEKETKQLSNEGRKK